MKWKERFSPICLPGFAGLTSVSCSLVIVSCLDSYCINLNCRPEISREVSFSLFIPIAPRSIKGFRMF